MIKAAGYRACGFSFLGFYIKKILPWGMAGIKVGDASPG